MDNSQNAENAKKHLQFIESAYKSGNVDKMNKFYSESNAYDPNQIIPLLMDAKLPDPSPLVIVCERFGFFKDLVAYLFHKSPGGPWIYLQENPSRLPVAMESLMDLSPSGATSYGVWQLVEYLSQQPFGFPADELISVMEQRNKLDLLQPWLEARIRGKFEEKIVHNTLAKIYHKGSIFLHKNQIYDRKVTANYCKDHPQLAYFVHEHGLDHKDFIDFCIEKQYFEKAAKRLVCQGDQQLWAVMLREDNKHRGQLIDQVIKTGLPEAKNPQNISAIIDAFEKAKLPHELIRILEAVVLNLSKNFDLECLEAFGEKLLLTAISADGSQVMELINKIQVLHDVPIIAKAAIAQELFEEGFALYRKFGFKESAVGVLIEKIKDLDRAFIFAKECNLASVWSWLKAMPMGTLQRQENGLKGYMAVLARERIIHENSSYDDCIFVLRDRGRYDQYMECQDFGQKLFEEMKPTFHAELEKTRREEAQKGVGVGFGTRGYGYGVERLLIFNNIGNQILLQYDHHPQLTFPHTKGDIMLNEFPPGLREVLFAKYNKESFIRRMHHELDLPPVLSHLPTMYTCFYVFGMSWQPRDDDRFAWCDVDKVEAPGVDVAVGRILKVVRDYTCIPIRLE